MREIKLRAWHTPLQKMLFPEKIHLDNGLCTAFDYLQDDGVYQIKTENNMGLDLMQFTGLLDKNGKGIFLGDIVRFYDDDSEEYIGEIKDNMYFQSCMFVGHKIYHIDMAMKGEIIGNIHENPDLLTNP